MDEYNQRLLVESFNNKVKEYIELGNTSEEATTLAEKDFSPEELKLIRQYYPTFNDVNEIVGRNFPHLTPIVETCLSVVLTLKLTDIKDPVGLNLIDDPSSEKTTVLSFFYNNSITYRTDDFTPRSFVTGLNINDEERLRSIDLLPRIENMVMVVPELAPIFGKRKEDLVENLSILTRVFDGHGFIRDTGSTGRRGYDRPIMFAWLGATTPINYKTWSEMIRLGTRMFFLKMPATTENTEDLIQDVFRTDYNEKVEECRQMVSRYLDSQFACGVKTVKWDKQKDEQGALVLITELVKLLTKLRSPLDTWKSEGDGEDNYQYVSPMKERPKRAMQILYNIVRGHALIFGRNYVTVEDIRILIPIVFSSMPDDRRKIWNLLVENDGYLDYENVARGFKCHPKHAYRIMKKLDILGVADLHEGDSSDEYNKERKHLALKDEYKSLLQKLKDLGLFPY